MEREEVILNFRHQLDSYIKFQEKPVSTTMMGYLEGSLMVMVAEGMDTYGEEVVVALAAILAVLSYSESTMTINPFAIRSPEDIALVRNVTKQKALEKAANWIICKTELESKERISLDETKNLLNDLFNKFSKKVGVSTLP